MTPTDIEKLKELEARATAGPWLKADAFKVFAQNGALVAVTYEDDNTKPHVKEADADFIAAAREALPSLIAALEAAQREGECHKQSADKNYALWNEERERGQAKDAEIERLKGELSEAVQTNVSALIESRNKLTEARIAARKSAIEECGVWLESQTSAFNCRDMVRALLSKQDSGKAQP